MTKHWALAALAALAFAAGCGGDDDEDAATTTPGTAAEAAPETAAEQTDTAETTETAARKPPKRGEDTGTEPVGDADVKLTEFEVELAKRSFPREGVYTLKVVNEGEATHVLEAEGPNGETETEEIPPGESAELDAYFVSGTYKLYCPIGDHEQRGMTARLRVEA